MKQKDFNSELYSVIAKNTTPSDQFLSLIKSSPKLSAQRALDVYREDYKARLSEAMVSTYAGTHFLLGDEEFLKLCSDYIDFVPSFSSNLDDFGDQFFLFCQNHASKKEYPFLDEMAQFEWSFKNLFHEYCDVGMDQHELQESILKDQIITLASSVTLKKFNFLISKLYSCKDQESAAPFDYNHEEYIVMYKKDQEIYIRQLEKSQWFMLAQFIKPSSFSSALENISKSELLPNELEDLFLFIGSSKILKRI